jgi:hypothetical protein
MPKYAPNGKWLAVAAATSVMTVWSSAWTGAATLPHTAVVASAPTFVGSATNGAAAQGFARSGAPGTGAKSHATSTGSGFLSVFQEASAEPLIVTIAGRAPVQLGLGEYSYGVVAAGSYTVTATSSGGTVVAGTVVVPSGQDVTALVYLNASGATTITGFNDDKTPPPVGESTIDIRNTANIGPVDVYLNGQLVAAALSDNPSSPTDVALTVKAGPMDFVVTRAGSPITSPLYSQSGDLVAGDLLNLFIVGDSTVSPSTLGLLTNAFPLGAGYRLYATDGGVFDFGNAGYYGSTGNLKLNEPVVGAAPTSIGLGYWLVASDGGIFSFGDANFYGSTGNIKLNKPIVGMAATPDDGGYWLVASDGGIFNYGDAALYGSLGATHLKAPIVGMASTPDGKGYWLVASDGGIFNYGDAAFYGSTGNLSLNKPIVGMVPTVDGLGYWLVASDGGVFSFGDAGYFGSTGGTTLNKPIVSIISTPDSLGYWLVASDGGVFSFGDAGYYGSTGGLKLNKPIVFGGDPGEALPV